MTGIAWIPGDGQTAPVLEIGLPWQKNGYQAWWVVILAGGIWRPWRWRSVVV